MGKEFDKLFRETHFFSEEDIAASKAEIARGIHEFNLALIQGTLGKKIRDEAASTKDKLKHSARRSGLGKAALWAYALIQPQSTNLLVHQREAVFARTYASIQSPIVGKNIIEKNGQKSIDGWVVEVRNYHYDPETNKSKRQLIKNMQDDIYVFQATMNQDDGVTLKPYARVMYDEHTSQIAMYDESYDFSNPEPREPNKAQLFKVLSALMYANVELG